MQPRHLTDSNGVAAAKVFFIAYLVLQCSLRLRKQGESMDNVGNLDRFFRAIIGLVLISLVYNGPQTVWGWIGLFPLATAITSFCPVYTLLGVRTRQQADND